MKILYLFIYLFTKPILKLVENEVVKETRWECQKRGCSEFGNTGNGANRG
jgi:hypothetical protein